MIQPKKKMKTAGFISLLMAMILIVGCFTTACQPKPDISVDYSALDENTHTNVNEETQATETTEQAVDVEQTVAEQPIKIIQDISSNASNTVTVDINAEVINNQPSNIPVASIASSPYTQDELLHWIEVFFGNTELYTRDMTKEDYDYWILQKQNQLNDETQLKAYAEDREIADLSVAKKQLEEVIERIKGEKNDAPDERITTDIETAINSKRGLNLLVKTREGFLGNVHGNIMTAFNDEDIYYRSRGWGSPQHIESDFNEPEFLTAKQLALDLVVDMGIDNYVFSDAYLQKDCAFTDTGLEYNGREYYVFCFDLAIGNSVLDSNQSYNTPPALVDMSGKDGYEDVPEAQYDEVISYDSLEVWVEGNKIVQFKHNYPVETTEIINNNVEIAVDYTQAVELAKQFAYTAYIDPIQNFDEAKLEINRIELVLIRIKEKDTGNDIVVPAWSFCGRYLFKYNSDIEHNDPTVDEDGWAVREGVEEFADVLFTINALDGTVINTYPGY